MALHKGHLADFGDCGGELNSDDTERGLLEDELGPYEAVIEEDGSISCNSGRSSSPVGS